MPPKQKADTAGYQQLKKDLVGGEPGRLYLFHGEETYLRDHYLGRLKELLLTGGMGEFNLHTIPAREMSPRRLEEAVDCLPMMAPRTLVLVRDFDLFKAGEKDREEYARAFAQLPDYCCLVFVYDLIPYKGDARTKLAAAIKQNGTVVNFARQDQGDLVDWVRRRFRALGKEIDTRLACDLIFLCGDLMTNLIGEIEKIGAYAKGGRMHTDAVQAVGAIPVDVKDLGVDMLSMSPPAGRGGVPHDGRHRRGELRPGGLGAGGAVPDAGAAHPHHVVSGPADAPALLRPAGHREGEGGPLCGGAVGAEALPGGQADDLGPPVLPELVPAGGGPLRPDGPGHEVHRTGRPGAADRPAAGAGGSVTAGGAAGGPGLRTVRRRMRGGEEIASHPGGCRGGGPV